MVHDIVISVSSYECVTLLLVQLHISSYELFIQSPNNEQLYQSERTLDMVSSFKI